MWVHFWEKRELVGYHESFIPEYYYHLQMFYFRLYWEQWALSWHNDSEVNNIFVITQKHRNVWAGQCQWVSGVPCRNAQAQGALWRHLLLFLSSIFQTNHSARWSGAVQVWEEVHHWAPGEEVLSSLQIWKVFKVTFVLVVQFSNLQFKSTQCLIFCIFTS